MARALAVASAVTQHAASAPSYVLAGSILVAAGVLTTLWGLILWRDTNGLLTKFHNYTIRSWRKIPVLGETWIQQTPFSAFRTQSLAIPLGGIICTGLGIFLIVRFP
jgi:hypothetical protein